MQLARIVKLIISLGCFVGDCIWRLAIRLLSRNPDPICTILYYHSVPDAQKQAFARQMDDVAALTEPVPVDRAPQLLPGKRYSAITFDDGFENVIGNAVPELQKRSIPATVFLPIGYLGQPAGWWPLSAPERQMKIAAAENWRQLPEDLISIGSHTVTHPHLLLLSETEAKRELSESRMMLQDLFKRNINIFSFPYGDFNDCLAGWCRDAGYERVFTSLPGNAFKGPNDFILGRVSAQPTDWTLEFRLKLLGAYRWLPVGILWKRRILSFLALGGRREGGTGLCKPRRN
jgi:peptidoglycan/xylan/chitin deacetylase (PgdA/CDA1 family)